jgi:hypothetical protein
LVLVEQLKAHEQPEHGAAERLGHLGGVMHWPRDERPIRPKAAVRDEEVQVRMPVRPGSVRLQARDDPHGEVALAGQCANGGGNGAGRDAGDLAEQATTVQAVGAEPLGDGEHHLPVRYRREQRGVQPLRPDGQPLGVTAGAEVAARAREREQVFVRTVVTANTREPVIEHAAGEELVSDLCDDGAPWAILSRETVVIDRLQAMQMIGHQPKERRRLGTSGLVDAARHQGRVGHARSGTKERRAYARLGREPSPFRCATGRFDAT